MMTMDGTVREILGNPEKPLMAEAARPEQNAPRNAAAAGAMAQRSTSSRRSVLEKAPISPAVAARRTGLLNIMEKPKTPQKLATRRKRICCHRARFCGRNAVGCSLSSTARIQAVIVATVMIMSAYIRRSRPDRISSLARSIPQVMNGKPGMMKSMEQIYPASCWNLTCRNISSSRNRIVYDTHAADTETITFRNRVRCRLMSLQRIK